ADMSHELRTPLNGVIGLLEALDAGRLEADQLALVGEIRESARKLNQIVNGLLDYGDADLALDQGGARARPASARPLKVLAADDNPTNRKVIELMLPAVGCEVVTVGDGAQALSAWRAGAYDLVLMDLRMPVMDGLAAITAMRAEERQQGRPRTPVIVLSANT